MATPLPSPNNICFEYPESSLQIAELVNEIFISRIYEGFGVKVGANDVVLDCGANIGLFTLYAGIAVGQKGRVICIEPMPETYDFLLSNIAANFPNESPEVIPLNLALSEKKESRLFMYSTERNASATGHVGRFDIVKRSNDAHEVKINCTTIDEIVLNQLKTKIDFIKMDIEGMEEKAIRGGRETIRLFKPKLAISAHFGSEDIIKELKKIHQDYKIAESKNIIYAW